MRLKILILFILMLLLLVVSSLSAQDDLGILPTPTPLSRLHLDNSTFLKGVAVVFYGPFDDVGLMRYNAPLFFDRIATMNINSIALVFPIFQDNAHATAVYKDPKYTPSNEILGIVVEEAKKRGISVLLKPVLDEGNLSKWRGAITPGGNLNDLQALDAWFDSYGSLMTEFAQFAQENRVEFLSIGTEFESIDKKLPKYTERWIREVIQPVRNVYTYGQITYASNWNDGAEEISGAPGFAVELDFLMIDAFYDLYAPVDATREELRREWDKWYNGDIGTYFEYGIPVVFGEVGVTARTGGHWQPWNGNFCPAEARADQCPDFLEEGQVHPLFDEQAQADYYNVTCDFARDINLSGIYWWEIDFYSFMRSHSIDSSHSPMDKLAEVEIALCYSLVFP